MGKTWILVANRVRARLLELDESKREVSEIGDFLNPDGRAPSGTRGENRPPRTMESVGTTRHAIEPHTEPAVKVADRFARQLIAILEDGRVHNHYDRLVLIATPRFLGRLRQCMDGPLRGHVVRELGRDMTRDKPETIRTLVTQPFQAST